MLTDKSSDDRVDKQFDTSIIRNFYVEKKENQLDNDSDIFTFNNILYENIAFDPRIRFSLNLINKCISKYSYLDIDFFDNKINISGLDKLINVIGSFYKILITNTSIRLSWVLRTKNDDTEICFNVKLHNGYLYYLSHGIVNETNFIDTKCDYDNDFLTCVYGKDLTLKYFDNVSLSNYADNRLIVTNGNIFNHTTNLEWMIQEILESSTNICKYYYDKYKLSKNNILIIKSKDLIGEGTIIPTVSAYAKHGQKIFDMDIIDTSQKYIDGYKKTENFIFDTMTEYHKENTVVRTFSIGSYHGQSICVKSTHPGCFIKYEKNKIIIKHDNKRFFELEFFSNNYIGGWLNFTLYSPYSNICVLKIRCKLNSTNIKSDQIKKIADYFLIFENEGHDQSEILHDVREDCNTAVFSVYGDIIDGLNNVIVGKSNIKFPQYISCEILDDRLSKYFNEFVSNPFVNISNESILDKKLITKIFNFSSDVFKIPIGILLNDDTNIKLSKTNGSEKILLREKKEELSSETINGIRTTYTKIYTYGNGGSHIVVKKVVSDDITNDVKEIVETTIDNDSGDIIDQSHTDYSKLSQYIKDKYNKNGSIGYKACVGPNSEHCIVKLYIYPDSYIATDHNMKKFRTNKCRVIDIATTNTNNIIEDFRYNICHKCGTRPTNKVVLPCEHMYCDNCTRCIIDTICCHPGCSTEIISVGDIILHAQSDKKLCEIKVAYSFITNNIQQYELNTDVVISDYDIDLEKRCSKGVHYHDNINEVYQWFEFLNIPEEMKKETYDKINLYDVQPNIMMNGMNEKNQQNADTSQSDQMKLHTKLNKKLNTESSTSSSIIIEEMKSDQGIRQRIRKTS